MTKLISLITGILTLIVAGFAFAVSFTSLEQMARDYNFPIPFLLPLTLEAGMIVFSANALYRKLNKEPALWQWVLVIFSSLIALIFNVLHATDIEDKTLISRIMFAIPSLFLLLAFENFLSQVNHAIKKSTFITSIKEFENKLLILRQDFDSKVKVLNDDFENSKVILSQTLSDLEEKVKLKTDKLTQIETFIKDKSKELKEFNSQLDMVKSQFNLPLTSKEERQKVIIELIKEGEGNLENLRKSVGVSYPTISNDIKELQLQKTVYKEGKIWKLNGTH